MSEQTVMNGVAALGDWGVIRAVGPEAATFLHGQLTNDTEHLAVGAACLAGYCSPKGRLLASFIVWRAAKEELLLACHASVLPATLKRLSMFVLRAKCKLSDASTELPLCGAAGATAQGLLVDAPVWSARTADDRTVIRLPDAEGVPRALVAGAAPVGEPLSLDSWRWLEVRSGIAVIEAATTDQFVPQMLNFEIVGGVNFQKGCYPGQEIVARAQYRGTVKRRAFLFDTEGAALAGQEIFHSGDAAQPAGRVANAAPNLRGGASVLAEVKLAALPAGSLHLGAPDGPVLTRQALPYALPLEPDEAAAGS